MTKPLDARQPVVLDRLDDDLRELGVAAGDTLLVQSSLGAIGWVCGGALVVVQALLHVLGPDGTLVVPTHTANNRDPATWADNPVPAAWWPAIRRHLPAFDPSVSPSWRMGAVAEQVRTWPGAKRSTHPQTSFAALGPHAAALTAAHPLECHLGEDSPLRRLEDADARVLLVGVGWDRCTAFHLAEYRQPYPPRREYSCAVRTRAGREWINYTSVALDDSDFATLGSDFEAESGSVVWGLVGKASAHLFSLRAATRFSTQWIGARRTGSQDAPFARGGTQPCPPSPSAIPTESG